MNSFHSGSVKAHWELGLVNIKFGARTAKQKLGAMAVKHKLGANTVKYKLGAWAGKHKLGTRTKTESQQRAGGREMQTP